VDKKGKNMRKQIILLLLIPVFFTSCVQAPPITAVNQNCIPVQASLPDTAQLTGTLILNDGEAYNFEGSNIIKTKLLYTTDSSGYTVSFSSVYVSPDQRKVIYFEYFYDKGTYKFISRQLVMLLPDRTQKIIPYVDEWGTLIKWFDDDWLLFSPTNRIPGTIILVNPITGQSREILPSFSDIYSLPPLPPWYSSYNPLPLYDESLSLAFYLRDGDGMHFGLWDIKHNRFLWERQVGDPTFEPEWSPDGKRIVIALRKDTLHPDKNELYSIDRSGNETQLTNISVNFGFVDFGGGGSWSSEENNFVFWLDARKSVDDKFNPELAVLDFRKKTITNYCISMGGSRPIWSPDGHQIAVSIQNGSPQFTVVVVDIVSNFAISIAEGASPVAWLR
jgi:WD40-like Beta Propeller Repeat